MLALDDYPELLRKLEGLKRRSAEATGELKAVLSTFNRDFGIASLKDAAEKLPAMQDEARGLAEQYTEAKQKLEAEYKDLLEGL